VTKQEQFDRVVAHLRAQGAKATILMDNGNQRCLYRAPHGRKCAAGILIPDDLYEKGMEGATIGDVIKRFPDLAEYIQREDISVCLLSDLQNVHDNAYITTWEVEFEKVAREHGLQYQSV